jgi:conjugative transfer signal peptidase TraF
VVVGVMGVMLWGMFLSVVRLNRSASAPVGVYWRQAITELRHGMLVAVPVPPSWHATALRMGIIPHASTPLMKPVAALPGDEICITEEVLWVRGVSYGPLVEGFSPAFDGCVSVAVGEVFLASEVPRSFDSRYFGMIPVEVLTQEMIPWWTW